MKKILGWLLRNRERQTCPIWESYRYVPVPPFFLYIVLLSCNLSLSIPSLSLLPFLFNRATFGSFSCFTGKHSTANGSCCETRRKRTFLRGTLCRHDQRCVVGSEAVAAKFGVLIFDCPSCRHACASGYDICGGHFRGRKLRGVSSVFFASLLPIRDNRSLLLLRASLIGSEVGDIMM